MTRTYTPAIRVEVDGVRKLPALLSFTLDTDMLTEADQLSLSYPATGDLVRDLVLDAPVRAYFDRRQVFAGRVTDLPLRGGVLQVTARDRVDRLLEESVPGVGFRLSGNLGVAIQKLVAPWFSRVLFSNAADRDIRSGRARVRVAGEPTITVSALRALGHYVDAGESRYGGVQKLLDTFRLLAWSSGDGSDFIVSRPNYSQQTLYRFVRTSRACNVASMGFSRSLAGRYSVIEMSGTQMPPGYPSPPVITPPGVRPRKRVQHSSRGRATDVSGDFLAAKRLLMNDSSIYPRDAQAAADRLLGQQQAKARAVDVVAHGFGQERALFSFDRVASVTLTEASDSEKSGESYVLRSAPYYVTAASFSSSGQGQSTTLRLVPVGTVLI